MQHGPAVHPQLKLWLRPSVCVRRTQACKAAQQSRAAPKVPDARGARIKWRGASLASDGTLAKGCAASYAPPLARGGPKRVLAVAPPQAPIESCCGC
eukprot:CAMPEP_0174721998 /NCGR_PEP_ID=MMETSP1094-20130205/37565_1 /TAXON_ID=156173 /ORGANISM="Chrysochromulina brevifilum, Strain UTEX LB 985" /LENGTH=96 /DNA_ID=CAMNT_0015922779 /DNA_START=76 /DNA_END=366 /DNA_ORIENTATION=-